MDLSNDPIADEVQKLMAQIFNAGIKLEGGYQHNKVFGILYKQSQRISELEAEKERLKGLIKSAHYAGWYNGLVNAYKHEFSWDEFSKLNNL